MREGEEGCAARYCEFVTELLSSPLRRPFLRHFRISSRRPFGVTGALPAMPGRRGQTERIYPILNPFSLERLRSRESSADFRSSTRDVTSPSIKRAEYDTRNNTREFISVPLPRQHADRPDNSRSPSCNYLP